MQIYDSWHAQGLHIADVYCIFVYMPACSPQRNKNIHRVNEHYFVLVLSWRTILAKGECVLSGKLMMLCPVRYPVLTAQQTLPKTQAFAHHQQIFSS